MDPSVSLSSLYKEIHRLPPFAMPKKRYTQSQIWQKAHAYLDNDQAKYADAVGEQGQPLFYDQSQTTSPKDPSPALAPSTLWRWLSWLARLTQLTRRASELIRNNNPNASVHRNAWQAPDRKHRSPERKRVLEQAMQCLAVRKAFEDQFGKEKFPRLAIACGWQ